jgi:tetratricopeptide (TPR) repeat protein
LAEQNKKRFVALGTVVALLLATLPSVAGAGLPSDGEQFLRLGIALRRWNKLDEAAQAFQRAFDADPRPKTQALLGLTLRQLQRWQLADKHLRAALMTSGDPYVEKERENLENSLRVVEGYLGGLAISGGEVGAEVLIDGQRVGNLPMPALKLPSGTVTVELRAHGFHPLIRRVVIPKGSVALEMVKMTSLRPPPVEVPRARPGEEGWRSTSPRRIAAWVTLGTGAAFILSAAIAQGVSNKEGTIDSTAAQNYAVAGFLTGGVLLVTSAVLFFWPSTSTGSPPVMAGARSKLLGCGPGPGELGVACSARW